MTIQSGTLLKNGAYSTGAFLSESKCCNVYIGTETASGKTVAIYQICNAGAPEGMLRKQNYIADVFTHDDGSLICIAPLVEGRSPESLAINRIDPAVMKGDAKPKRDFRIPAIILLVVCGLAIGIYFGRQYIAIPGLSDSSDPTEGVPVLADSEVTDREIELDSLTATYTGAVNPDGMPHGKGMAVYSNSIWESYDGSWADGKWDGKGTLIYKAGDRFTGTFSSGEFLKGTYTVMPDDAGHGEYFTGTFRAGMPYSGKWYTKAKRPFQKVINGESYPL